MTARHHAGAAVCDECGDSYNKRLGRRRGGTRGIKLILCPDCAKETDLKEEADADVQPGPRVDDDCAGCGVPLKVVHRSWEIMRGFWGRVFCANLCPDCEPQREAKADAIYVTIGRRQRRLVGLDG